MCRQLGAAVGDDLLGDALAGLGVDVRDHHRGAFAGQRLGVGLADAAAGSGDDRDLVVELPHISLSFEWPVATRQLPKCVP